MTLNATGHTVSNVADETLCGCNVLLSVLLFLSLQKDSPSIQLRTHRLFPTVQEEVVYFKCLLLCVLLMTTWSTDK